MQSVSSTGAASSFSAPTPASAGARTAVAVKEDLSSGLVNMEIESLDTTTAVKEDDQSFKLEDAESILTQLQGVTGVAVVMDTLRARVVNKGQGIQRQIADSKVFGRIVDLCVHTESADVLEAACRLLCALVVRNQYVSDMVIGSPVLPKLFALVEGAGEGIFPCALPAALWTLNSLWASTESFRDRMASLADILRIIVSLQCSPNEETQLASAFLLRNIAAKTPAQVPKLLEAGILEPLVSLLGVGAPNPKGLACLTAQALVQADASLKIRVADLGAVPKIVAIMQDDDSDVQNRAAAASCIGALAFLEPVVQNRLRTDGSLEILVRLLSSPIGSLRDQAAATIYNVCARISENQICAGSLGAIEPLVAALPRNQGSTKSAEKIIACILCLCLKRPENQLRVLAVPESIPVITKLINCSSARIQGLSAGLVRTLCPQQPKIQASLVAHGAMARLTETMTSPDPFAQEQSVAGLFNLIRDYPGSYPFLRSLDIFKNLFAIMSNCSKPTDLAYTCSLMILWTLSQNNEEVKDLIRSAPGVVPAILRFCHPSCSTPRLRGHADRLACCIVPDLHADILKQCNVASLEALRTFKVTPPPALLDDAVIPAAENLVEPPQPKQILCGICLDDRALGEDGTPKDMVFLPCFHPFHVACISTWLQAGKDCCPYCKLSVIANVNRLTGQTLANDGTYPFSNHAGLHDLHHL